MSYVRPYNWVFTWNNPDTVLGPGLLSNLVDANIARYVVYQLESGDEGTNHYQGYVEFVGKKTLAAVKKLISQAHWEPRRGTAEEAKQYCKKAETRVSGPWELGTPKSDNQGKRSDLENLKAELDSPEGNPWENCFGTMMKYHRGAEKYLELKHKCRTEVTEVEVHIGEPGTGKTEWVQRTYPDAYWKQSTKWWDLYEGHEVVVLDEFKGWLPYNDLLRLMDGTPMIVEKKTGQKQFVARKLVIISNYGPWTWYKFDEERLNFEALRRRLNRDGGLWVHKKFEEPEMCLNYEDFVEVLEGKKEE